MKIRCPKNGQYVSMFTCSKCKESPKGWREVDPNDPYEICREFNGGKG